MAVGEGVAVDDEQVGVVAGREVSLSVGKSHYRSGAGRDRLEGVQR